MIFQTFLLLVLPQLILFFDLSRALDNKRILNEEHHHRIAFGSCYNPNKGDKIWQLMQSFTPNQLVLLGDQIYPDFHPKYKYKRPYATPEMIAGEYNKFLSQPGWKNLTSSLSHDWLATYDDHDYGINNGDKTYQYRNESMAMFRQFYGKGGEAIEVVDPNTGETRSERKSGVYSAREFSFPIHPKDSNSKFFRYKIILLDNRSNKDPRGTVNGTMLGEQQWQWLEDQLSADNLKHLDLVLLGTGIQVIANDKLVEENWGDFPEERKRLINLVSRTQYYHTNIVMLSGDVHSGEITQMHCAPEADFYEIWKRFQLIELTSSGLSHTFMKITDDYSVDPDDTQAYIAHQQKAARTPEGKIIVPEKRRNILAELFTHLYQNAYPGQYREHRISDNYQGLHFGLIDFYPEPESSPDTISGYLYFQLINHEGITVMSKKIALRHFPNSFSRTLPAPEAISYPQSESKKKTVYRYPNFHCEPYWGTYNYWNTIQFRATMVMFGLIFGILPISTFLWMVGASIYYICIGSELRRRRRLETEYLLHKKD